MTAADLTLRGDDRSLGGWLSWREGFMLSCGGLLYFFANLQRVAVPGSIFDVLQQDTAASAAGIAALGPAFMFVYALAQLVVGPCVDRFGGARVIVAGCSLFFIGSLLFPLCGPLWAMLVCRAAIGLGASTVYLGMVWQLQRRFSGSLPFAIGILILVGYTGGIVANAPFVWCVEWLGWRVVMAGIGLLTMLFYVAFLCLQLWLPRPEQRPLRLSPASFIAVLAAVTNRRLIIFCGVQFGLYYVLQTVIGKKFLEDHCQMSATDASLVMTVMGVLCAVSGVVSASLNRLLGGRTILVLRCAGAVSALAFLVMTLAIICGADAPWLALPLCIIAAVASTAAISIPLLSELNPADQTGTVVSIFNGSCFLVVAVFGSLVGSMLSCFEPCVTDGRMVYGPSAYLLVFAVFTVCSCIACWQIMFVRIERL